jgi:hypothetical protein
MISPSQDCFADLYAIECYLVGNYDNLLANHPLPLSVSSQPCVAKTPSLEIREPLLSCLVIYIHQLQRDLPANLLDIIQDWTPEHTILINDMEYVQIYRTETFHEIQND